MTRNLEQGEKSSGGDDNSVSCGFQAKTSLPGIFIQKQTLCMLGYLGAVSPFFFCFVFERKRLNEVSFFAFLPTHAPSPLALLIFDSPLKCGFQLYNMRTVC